MLSPCHKKVNRRAKQHDKPVMQMLERFPAYLVLLLALLFGIAGSAYADTDTLAKANRLLRITETSKHFDAAAVRQTQEIIRTYASIVDTTATVQLPDTIKVQIAACYAEVYAWENFTAGIALILAENFTAEELELLIGFYSDLSIPPNRIGAFKATLEKSSMIEQLVTNHIEQHSDDCQDYSMILVRDFLANQHTAIAE